MNKAIFANSRELLPTRRFLQGTDTFGLMWNLLDNSTLRCKDPQPQAIRAWMRIAQQVQVYMLGHLPAPMHNSNDD